MEHQPPGKRKKCFFLARIGEHNSEIRRQSDQVLKHIVRPAVERFEYDIARADELHEPGIITHHIIQHLCDDELVVADLTGHNPNVFYELAIRHSVRRPTIHIIKMGDRIPFDVNSVRVVYYSTEDLDIALKAVTDIGLQLRAIESNPRDCLSPISIAIDVKRLNESPDPSKRIVAEIRGIVTASHEIIRNVQDQIGQTDSVLSFVKSASMALRTQSQDAAAGDAQPGASFVERLLAGLRKMDDRNRFLVEGDNCLASEQLERALVKYEQALNIDKTDQLALIGKAKALKRIALQPAKTSDERRHLLAAAIEVMNIAIGQYPAYDRALFNRACYKCLAGLPKNDVLDDLSGAIRVSSSWAAIAREDSDLAQIQDDVEFLRIVSSSLPHRT